jgi:hypothetical protein
MIYSGPVSAVVALSSFPPPPEKVHNFPRCPTAARILNTSAISLILVFEDIRKFTIILLQSTAWLPYVCWIKIVETLRIAVGALRGLDLIVIVH